MAAQGTFDLGGPAPSQDRLFTCIKPDADALAAITTLLAQTPGFGGAKPRNADTLHLSLADLGPFSEAAAKSAIDRLQTVAVAPFDVCLDRRLSFPKPGGSPLVLLAAAPNPGLDRLYTAHRVALADIPGVKRPARLRTPHLTLLYARQKLPETPIPPIVWTVRQFSLVQSHYGEDEHTEFGPWPLSA